MVKFHINPDGNVKECSATKRICKYGFTEQEHFDNKVDAEKEAESILSAQYEIFNKRPTRNTENYSTDKRFVFSDSEFYFDEVKYRLSSAEFINSLSIEEEQSVKDYVFSAYQSVNESLWNDGFVKSEDKQLDNDLSNALKKYDGEKPKFLYRNLGGPELNKEFLENNYQVGDIIVFPGYSSTSETLSKVSAAAKTLLNELDYFMNNSSEEEVNEIFSQKKSFLDKVNVPKQDVNNVMFKITNVKNAAPVSVARGRVNEQEWLIDKKSSFRIKNINRDVEVFKDENDYLNPHPKRQKTFLTVFELEQVN